MNLADKKEVSRILNNQDFSFKKSLGQNFIIDPSVCPAMAETACDPETGVIEIGAGAGVLTRELSARAKRVVALEVDPRLKDVLSETLSGCDNVELVFADVLKTDLHKLIKEKLSDCRTVSVCANLPYYITSPVIMLLLESGLPITSVTAMVQLEAAQRLCAPVGSRQAGAVTVAVAYYSQPRLLFTVPRESFLPPPKVDSAVISLQLLEKPAVTVNDEKFFFSLSRACFAQRRKTLLNTVSNTLGVEKQHLRECLEALSLNSSVRGEQLTLEQLAELSNLLKKQSL